MYTIINSAIFDQQAEEWAGSLERWDEVWFAYDYILAQNPFLGEPVPGTNLRALHLRIIPPPTVYYEIRQSGREVLLCHLAAPNDA
jgi:hypothetical protein